MSRKKGKRILKARAMVSSTPIPFKEVKDVLEKYLAQCGVKFNETVEIITKLSVDPKKSNQIVRGSVLMPKGLGKKVRVAVFTQHDLVKDALNAGADIAGCEDLIEEIKKGRDDFDVCIATPDMMPKIAVLGKILGTKGKMPNVKLGTVTDKVKEAINNVKKGMVEFKAEKNSGIVQAGIGKIDFPIEDLKENIVAFIDALIAAKPAQIKGNYIVGNMFWLKPSQGPAFTVDVSTLSE